MSQSMVLINQCSRKRYLELFGYIWQWKQTHTISKASLKTGVGSSPKNWSYLFVEPCIRLKYLCPFHKPIPFPKVFDLTESHGASAAALQLSTQLWQWPKTTETSCPVFPTPVPLEFFEDLWTPQEKCWGPSTGTRASSAFALRPSWAMRLKLTLQCLNLKPWIQTLQPCPLDQRQRAFQKPQGFSDSPWLQHLQHEIMSNDGAQQVPRNGISSLSSQPCGWGVGSGKQRTPQILAQMKWFYISSTAHDGNMKCMNGDTPNLHSHRVQTKLQLLQTKSLNLKNICDAISTQ